MSVDPASEGPPPSNALRPRPFAAASARWIVAAFLGIGLLWLLGIEAILYHATPLAARPRQALADVRVLPTMIALAGASALLLRQTVLLPHAPLPRRWAAACAAALGVMAAAWALGPASALEALVFHAFCMAVFTAGAGFVLAAAQAAGLPGGTVSPAWGRALALAAAVLALVFAGALALTPTGLAGLPQAQADAVALMLPDLAKVGHPQSFLRDYTALHANLSPPAQAHPPGATLLVWAASLLVGPEPLALTLALMLLAAAAILPLYAWVAALAGRGAAVYAAMLAAVMPAVALFSATTLEAACAGFGLLALWCHARSLAEPRTPTAIGWAATGGCLVAAATMVQYPALGLGYWFLLITLMRGGRAWLSAAVLGLAFALPHAAIGAITGFSYIEGLRLAWEIRVETAQANSHAAWYWWPLLNPLAMAFYAGIPLCLLAARAAGRTTGPVRETAVTALAACACMAVAYPGLGGGEQALYPAYALLLLAAAPTLEAATRRQRSLAPAAVAMGALAVQAWLIQVYFER